MKNSLVKFLDFKVTKTSWIIFILLTLSNCTKKPIKQSQSHPMEEIKHKHTNELIHSDSPYLLQHAHNPVNWYAWSDKALEKAKAEDKPILLSIGYSACHWCHVMEKESFENEDIAKIMNDHFICIKVDKEERPDVDALYMDAVQHMGVNGGWPLNVFLTSDQKPFYGGTYFPAQKWANLLYQISKAYKEERAKIDESANLLNDRLKLRIEDKFELSSLDTKKLDLESINKVANNIYDAVDHKLGGMNRSPKFPMPSIWMFLLEAYAETDNTKYLNAVETTLDEMAKGGIYDQLGGGFARYSTDEKWLAPHFEKMLYDNGQLISLYAKAYQITKNSEYKKVLDQTVDFLERELMSPEGGFYAALDADSEGEEGKFYVWEYSDLNSILTDQSELDIFSKYYNVKENGNWEHNKNILHRKKTDAKIAKELNLSVEELEEIITDINSRLLKERNKRVKPGLDDKIICSWNALALKGLSDAYAYTGEERYLNLALKNAVFLRDNLLKDDATLFRTYKNNKAKINAFLEDYATLAEAFLRLYEVSQEEQWIITSESLTNYALENFKKEDNIFFDFTNHSSSSLIAKKQDVFDNVIPSSNSIFANVLYKLGIALNKEEYIHTAENMSNATQNMIVKDGQFLSNWASLSLKREQNLAQIIVVGKRAKEFTNNLLRSESKKPFVILAKENSSSIKSLEDKKSKDGGTEIYICVGKTCYAPVKTEAEALNLLNKVKQ